MHAYRSKDGWLVVQEYESDDLASNSEDKKRLKKAKNEAEKKRKNPERSELVSSKRFKSGNDNQLFRGNIFLLSALLCYFSNSVVCFVCVTFKRKIIYGRLSEANYNVNVFSAGMLQYSTGLSATF